MVGSYQWFGRDFRTLSKPETKRTPYEILHLLAFWNSGRQSYQEARSLCRHVKENMGELIIYDRPVWIGLPEEHLNRMPEEIARRFSSNLKENSPTRVKFRTKRCRPEILEFRIDKSVHKFSNPWLNAMCFQIGRCRVFGAINAPPNYESGRLAEATIQISFFVLLENLRAVNRAIARDMKSRDIAFDEFLRVGELLKRRIRPDEKTSAGASASVSQITIELETEIDTAFAKSGPAIKPRKYKPPMCPRCNGKRTTQKTNKGKRRIVCSTKTCRFIEWVAK